MNSPKKLNVIETIRKKEKSARRQQKIDASFKHSIKCSSDVIECYNEYHSHRFPSPVLSLDYIVNHFFLYNQKKVYILDMNFSLYPIEIKPRKDFPDYIKIFFSDLSQKYPNKKPFNYYVFLFELLSLYSRSMHTSFATSIAKYWTYLSGQSVKFFIPPYFFNPQNRFFINSGKIVDRRTKSVLNYKYYTEKIKSISSTHSELDDSGTEITITDPRLMMPKSVFQNLYIKMFPLLTPLPNSTQTFQNKSKTYIISLPEFDSTEIVKPLHLASCCSYDWSFWIFICKIMAILYVRPSLANLCTIDFRNLSETKELIDLFIRFLNKLSCHPSSTDITYFKSVRPQATFHDLQCTNHKYIALSYHPHFTNNSLCTFKNLLESKKIIYNDYICGKQVFTNQMAILFFATQNADIDYLQKYLPLNILTLTDYDISLIKEFISRTENISFHKAFIFTSAKYGFKFLFEDTYKKIRNSLSPKESVLTFLLNCTYRKDENRLSRQEIYDVYIEFLQKYQTANLYSGFTVRTFITLLNTVKPPYMIYKKVHLSTGSNQYYVIGLGISLPKSRIGNQADASDIITNEEFQKRLNSINDI